MNVLGRPDARDWSSLPDDGMDYLDGLDKGVAGLKIALSPGLGLVAIDPEIDAAIRNAAAMFEDLGAEVTEIDPPINDPHDDYYIQCRMAARPSLNP